MSDNYSIVCLRYVPPPLSPFYDGNVDSLYRSADDGDWELNTNIDSSRNGLSHVLSYYYYKSLTAGTDKANQFVVKGNNGRETVIEVCVRVYVCVCVWGGWRGG